jgi:outer membrane protein TolC
MDTPTSSRWIAAAVAPLAATAALVGCAAVHAPSPAPASPGLPRVDPSVPVGIAQDVASTQAPRVLGVDDVVALARGGSERVLAAAARARAADARAAAARGDVFLPKIDVFGSWWRSDRELAVDTDLGPLRIASHELGVEMVRATQPLIDVADFFFRFDAERAGAETARLAAARAADVAELTAVEAFYEVLSRREEIAALERSVDVLGSHVEDARHLYDAGRVPENDVTKVDLEWSRRRQTLLAARNAERGATLDLLAALAMPPDAAVVLEAPPRPADAAPPPLPELVASALRARADLRALAAADRRLALLATAEAADYLPRIEGFVDYQYDIGDALRDNDAFEGGVLMHVRLFDGLARDHRRAAVLAKREGVAARRRDLERRIAIEVERARLAIEEQRSALAVAERSVAQAEASLRMEDDLYRHDRSATAAVLDSELTLFERRVDAAHARYGALAAAAELKAAMGGA